MKNYIGIIIGLILIMLIPTSNLGAEEIILLKNGGVVKGKILEVDEKKVRIQMKNVTTAIPLKNISPCSIYRIKLKFIDPKDALAFLQLGEFCQKYKMYYYARRSYRKAAKIDDKLLKSVLKKIAKVDELQAKEKFEEGLKKIAEKKYEDAVENFNYITRYLTNTSYFKKAQQKLEKVRKMIKAAEITKKNLKLLKDMKEKMNAKKKQKKKEWEVLDRVKSIFKKVREHNKKGLENDALNVVSRAKREYFAAEKKLFGAKKILIELKKRTKSSEILSATEKWLKEVDSFLVIIYTNLGHLYAVHRSYKNAMIYIGKALGIEPKNRYANELRLIIASQRIRFRAKPKKTNDD